MSQYDNNLSGVLFKNDRKEKETHPDYQGSCEIDNHDYWISAWIKVGKEGSKKPGEKFMSLAFKLKDQQQAPSQPKPSPTPAPMDDDDIPF